MLTRRLAFLNHFKPILMLGLTLALGWSSAFAGQTRTDWKVNTEARSRLLTPFGLEADGRTLYIGLEIQLEPGWHAYWKNPGDAGLAPEFTILDSTIISELEVLFTPPKFYPFGGGLDANGYADEVVYPVRLKLTESAASAGELELNLDMFYLVCKDLCIPHDEKFSSTATLTNTPARTESSGSVAEKLNKALSLLPLSPDELNGYGAGEELFSTGAQYLHKISVKLPETQNEFPEVFFHATPDLKLKQSKFSVGSAPDEIIIETIVSTKVAGKKIESAEFGYLLTNITAEGKTVSVEKVSELSVTEGGSYAATAPGISGEQLPLWEIILFAILGGLILNIMPCVLPVLSMKLMGVVQQSGEARGKITRGMLLSSSGIIVSFLILASAAVIAKSAGAAVGWGVQFQEPTFVTFLALIVFLFGLNLWGIFEVTLPVSVSSGAAMSASHGGHFVQGMFATLLATPCSAPFLGTAVTFALSSPAWIIYSVFAAMGVGMALPYLIIAAAPSAIRYLPRPGAWMEKAKIFFGFLLMATVIWLMYVLSLQADSATLTFVWLGLLSVALVVWLKQALAPYAQFFSSARGALTVVGVLAISGYTIYLSSQSEISSAGVIDKNSDIAWAAYSEEALNKQLSSGNVVFIDVTAEWCVTCKFNEKFFIETDQIISRIQENNIVALKADWTNRNAEISDFLARYGRSGIPFYIIFYGGDMSNYLALPITITGNMLAEKLDEAIEKNRAFAENLNSFEQENDPDNKQSGFILTD